jgi:hypothetical protein
MEKGEVLNHYEKKAVSDGLITEQTPQLGDRKLDEPLSYVGPENG